MAILTYINGFPLFNSHKEAIDYGLIIGIPGTHVPRYKIGPHTYRSGYMIGDTHEVLMATQGPDLSHKFSKGKTSIKY